MLKIIIATSKEDLDGRLETLESGWYPYEDLEIEVVGDTKLYCQALTKWQTVSIEPHYLATDISKDEWEAALEKYKKEHPGGVDYMNLHSVLVSSKSEAQVVKFLRQISQEQANFDRLVNNILSISNADHDKFLEDFEAWYTMLDVGTPKLIYLEFIYAQLAMGNRLPWEF